LVTQEAEMGKAAASSEESLEPEVVEEAATLEVENAAERQVAAQQGRH